jgi:hypothetical protein
MRILDLLAQILGAPKDSPEAKTESEIKERDVLYQTYIDERKNLVEGETKSAEQFDRTLVTLAGGGLAVSLAFIEKIAPNPKKETLWLLAIAWAGLVLSLLFILCSFLTSQRAYRQQRAILEVDFLDPPGTQRPVNKWAVRTMWLNRLAIGLFIIGACMLAAFTITNMWYKVQKADSSESNTDMSKETNKTEKVQDSQTRAQVPAESPRRPTATPTPFTGSTPAESPKRPAPTTTTKPK